MNRKKLVVVVVVFLLLVSTACRDDQHARSSTKTGDSSTAGSEYHERHKSGDVALTSGGPAPQWLEEVVRNYLEETDNEMIRQIGPDSESWIIDNIEVSDTGKYIYIQIGHNVMETDGSEPRFVTDQWIGVDSQTRTIYEYDVAMDTTIIWRKNGL